MNYILQKDLPGLKPGAIFSKENKSDNLYVSDFQSDMKSPFKGLRFHQEQIENNPEWFKPEEEEFKIDCFKEDEGKGKHEHNLKYSFFSNKKIKMQWAEFEQTLEKMLSGELITQEALKGALEQQKELLRAGLFNE